MPLEFSIKERMLEREEIGRKLDDRKKKAFEAENVDNPVNSVSPPTVTPNGSTVGVDLGKDDSFSVVTVIDRYKPSKKKSVLPKRNKKKAAGEKRFSMTDNRIPPLECNSCSWRSQCPAYKPNYECAFLGVIEDIKVEGKESLEKVLSAMIELQAQRIQFAHIGERLTGTIGDEKVTNMVAVSSMLFKNFGALKRDDSDSKGESKVVVVLQQMFSGNGASNKISRPVIDVPVEILDEDGTMEGEEDKIKVEFRDSSRKENRREARQLLMSEVSDDY